MVQNKKTSYRTVRVERQTNNGRRGVHMRFQFHHKVIQSVGRTNIKRRGKKKGEKRHKGKMNTKKRLEGTKLYRTSLSEGGRETGAKEAYG